MKLATLKRTINSLPDDYELIIVSSTMSLKVRAILVDTDTVSLIVEGNTIIVE